MSNGVLLGVITIPAMSSRNNTTTSSPFAIPFECLGIMVVLDDEASGYAVVTGTGSGLTALTTDFSQIGPTSLQFVLTPGSTAPVVAIRSLGAGGTARIIRTDGKIQS